MRGLLMIGGLLVALPAQAQFWGGTSEAAPDYGATFQPSEHRGILRNTDRAIDSARRDGRISSSDARDFRRERNRIAAAGNFMGRDGLTPGERSELVLRALVLKGLVEARISREPG